MNQITTCVGYGIIVVAAAAGIAYALWRLVWWFVGLGE